MEISEPAEYALLGLLFLLKLYFARTFGAETVRTLIARQIEACAAFLTRLQERSPASGRKGGSDGGQKHPCPI